MKKIILAVSFILICLNAHAADLLNYLPDSSMALIKIDLNRFMTSSMYTDLVKKGESENPEGTEKAKQKLEALEKELGISFKNIKEFYLGFSPEKSGKNAINGVCDLAINADKLKKYLEKDAPNLEKIEFIEYSKHKILYSKRKKDNADPKPKGETPDETYICPAKDTLFISTSLDSMKGLIDLYSGKSKKSAANSQVAKNIKSIPASMVAITGIIDKEMKLKLKENPQAAMFAGLDFVNCSVDFIKGFDLIIEGLCDKAESAQQVATSVRAFTGIYGFMAMQYGLADIINKLKIDAKDKSAIISLSLSKADIDKIAKKLEELRNQNMNAAKGGAAPLPPGLMKNQIPPDLLDDEEDDED